MKERVFPLSQISFLSFFIVFAGIFFFLPSLSSAAILSLDPAGGTFVVGSTFEVPIFVNTTGEPINAIQIEAKFPPDKLQIVSPSTGRSVITLWTEQPSFNNETGVIRLQGVIPEGLVASRGLVTTIVFRVKTPGDAYVKFLGETRVLKHDGLGTDVLQEMNGGVYRLILPPPLGPIVSSETHPDPSFYYRTANLFLSWVPENPAITNYSYLLNAEVIDIPDTIAEGEKQSVIYRDLPDGKHFFHIRGQQAGVWGGTTHFGVNIDRTPPAEFGITVLPGEKVLQSRQALIQFATTDTFSGLDHYEIKVIPLTDLPENSPVKDGSDQPFFIEATSPYIIPEFQGTGKYDILVRAYDKAGNFRESQTSFHIVSRMFATFNDSGIEFGARILPWWLLVLFFILFICALTIVGLIARLHHHRAHERLEQKTVPIELSQGREDLNNKQRQYGTFTKLSIVLFFTLPLFFGGQKAQAQGVFLEPPIITTISKNISNQEIFYVGGVVPTPESQVVLYIQNPTTGEIISRQMEVDGRGEWFYRHNGFLSSGGYILWTQAFLASESSPPSPREEFFVSRAALQIGATRLSYGFLLQIFSLIFLFVIFFQILYILHHRREAKRKHSQWIREIQEAQEEVRRDFAVLKRDIEAELAVIKKAKLSGALRMEEEGREAQLLQDLAWAESNIKKEIADIEKTV